MYIPVNTLWLLKESKYAYMYKPAAQNHVRMDNKNWAHWKTERLTDGEKGLPNLIIHMITVG